MNNDGDTLPQGFIDDIVSDTLATKDHLRHYMHHPTTQNRMASSVRPLQGGPRIPRGTSPRMNPHHIQTSGHGNANMRYSYTNTPSELHRPVFHQFASPQDSMIEESPISPHEGGRPQSPEHTMNIRVTSEIPSRAHSRSPYNFEPPHGVHPALYAPYAEPVQSPMQHSSDMKPPQSPGPIPIKTHQQPMSPAAPMHGSDDAENKVEYAGINPDADHTPLVYDPNALAGPNVTLDNHRPGQVSHPNAAVDPEWKHGLCEVDTLCCTGLVCPCIVYGKTQYRLSRKAQKQEPTDLLSYKTCNGSCGVMAAACGLQCQCRSELAGDDVELTCV